MSEAPFTVRDTPAIRARIHADLERVLAATREADPHLRALVLTGGFARGEGAVYRGEPQNDYDFVAVRSTGAPRTPYPELRRQLEEALGIHVDLAPVAAWRLGWTARSIFWYETALRGRVIWGEDVLGRIRVRTPGRLNPQEGMRLLVNRSAGLLLVTPNEDPHAHRIQAAKAFLAALDAHMLARGVFPPTQTERWHAFLDNCAAGLAPRALVQQKEWLHWAYTFKVDPENAPPREASAAWQSAAQAILGAVPIALAQAGLGSLDEYERRDGLMDRLQYFRRSRAIPGARRILRYPTGRVRVATLRLLQASADGVVRPQDADRMLSPLARIDGRPLRVLENLRGATLQ